jgi:hypothetical protein
LLLANTFEQAVLAALAAAYGMAGLASTAGDWQIVAGHSERRTMHSVEPPRRQESQEILSDDAWRP